MAKKEKIAPAIGDLFDPPAPAPLPSPVKALRTRPDSESLYFDGPYREFEYNDGIHLADSVLWFDCQRRNEMSFLSSPLAGDVGRNRQILSTEATYRIATKGKGRMEVLTGPYGHSFQLGSLKLSMYPAGHVLGSAQLLVERQKRRVVFASEVSLRKSATAEAIQIAKCNTLALRATYGLRVYSFPPRQEVLQQLRSFIDKCLAGRSTPVLIANRIGMAQELMVELGNAGYKLRVHRSVHEIAKVYAELGVTIPAYKKFNNAVSKDEVLIFPPILRQHSSLRKLKDYRTAFVGSRAVEASYVYSLRVDESFPLSDTADFADLLRYVKKTGADEVYLTGGYVDEFAEALRDEGLRVYDLTPPKQLSLFMG